MCDCQSEVWAAYLFGVVSMLLFVLWYGRRAHRERMRKHD